MEAQTDRKGIFRRAFGAAGGTAALVFGAGSFAMQLLPWLLLSDDEAAGRAFGYVFGYLFGAGAAFFAVLGVIAGVIALVAAKHVGKVVAIAGLIVSILAGTTTIRLFDRIS